MRDFIPDIKCNVSTHSVGVLLAATNPPPSRLRSRYLAVQRLHDDIFKFVGWDALCESLQLDLNRLQARIELVK